MTQQLELCIHIYATILSPSGHSSSRHRFLEVNTLREG